MNERGVGAGDFQIRMTLFEQISGASTNIGAAAQKINRMAAAGCFGSQSRRQIGAGDTFSQVVPQHARSPHNGHAVRRDHIGPAQDVDQLRMTDMGQPPCERVDHKVHIDGCHQPGIGG